MGISVRKATMDDYRTLCGLFEEIDAPLGSLTHLPRHLELNPHSLCNMFE